MTSRTIDIKLMFEQTDMVPGPKGRIFRRNVLLHGGTTDDRGYSYSDHLLRQDEGALDINGNPVVGAPALPAGAGAAAARRAYDKRKKESYTYLVKHIACESTKILAADPPYFGYGAALYDYVMAEIIMPYDTSDIRNLNMKWQLIEIITDIGVSENTIKDALVRLRVENADRPPAQRFSDDDIAEKLLSMIEHGSNTFALIANKELNALEGVPGAPGVREFQRAIPALPGPGGLPLPRPRDLNGIVNYFHRQWRDAVRRHAIPVAAATGSVMPKPGGKTVESGRMATERGFSGSAVSSPQSSQPLGSEFYKRPGSPSNTLPELTESGFLLTRGTVTTSDFRMVPRMDLGRAAEDGDGGDDFCVEVCNDADDTPSIEIVCNCCRGIGHPARICPSAKRFRSFSFVIQLLENAKHRAEERGATNGHAPGGRRPLPRGQRQPFAQTPRRFQRSQPFRRFSPATPRQIGQQAQEPQEETPPSGGEAEADTSHSLREAQVPEQKQTASESAASAIQSTTRSAVLEREQAPPTPTSFGAVEDYFGHSASEVQMEVAPSECPPSDGNAARSKCLLLVAMLLAAAASFVGGVADALREVRDTAIQAATAERVGTVLLAVAVMMLLRGAGADAARPPNLPIEWSAVVPRGEQFDRIEKCHLSEAAPIVSRGYRSGSADDLGLIKVCFDSGASAYVFSDVDEWMLSEVTDASPNVGLEVASGTRLRVKTIGNVNTVGPPKVVVDSFRLGPNGTEIPAVTAPSMTRVLITPGIKPGTRLIGVRSAKVYDATFSYFNDDNSAGMDDCVRWANGTRTRFVGTHHELYLRRLRAGEMIDTGYVGVSTAEWSDIDIHAGLMHVHDARIRSSGLTIGSKRLHRFCYDAADCAGCRLGKTEATKYKRSSAPSKGGRAAYGSRGPPVPSTSGYSFFGQRVDTDMCTAMPKSWPHGFTVFTNFCDRHTAEFYLFYQVGAGAYEVASSMNSFGDRFKHRLRDGRIWRWHLDNDLAYEGPDVKEAAAELVTSRTQRVPHESNSNPVPERNFGIVEYAIKAACAHADAPLCLWPWAASQFENVAYFISTRAHEPPVSPFQFSHPDAGEPDLSWARPLFCDVTVHVAKRDVGGKMNYTGTDGCYLGHDFKRNCEYVYCPGLRRLSSFTVSTWRTTSFTICKMITSDTPLEYRETEDLRFGPATLDLLPKRHVTRGAPAAVGSTALEREGEPEQSIADGLTTLEREGEAAFEASAISAIADNIAQSRSANFSGLERSVVAAEERALIGGTEISVEAELEINLIGSDAALKVATQFGVPKFQTVEEAMKSKYWPAIKEAMEEEIAGKLANKAWKVVPRGDKRVMKGKWVIDVKLNDDGSIKRWKARFVGCGYSQVEGQDFDKTYAATLPGCCLRMWCSIVADEDLETDKIDGVKAFTQSDIDRELYCEMPLGFAIEGYVLQLLKALEGIRQGAYLWFQHNKWAWNKCGCYADSLIEPNLYTHESLSVLCAVFADDVGAAFHNSCRSEYLLIRAEYGKLIKIDSPSPSLTVEVTMFTGVNIARDRAAKTLTISQLTYLTKLADRRKGQYTLNSTPTPPSKAARDAFDKLTPGTAETAVKRQEYLEILGELAWPTAMTWPEAAYYTSVLGSGMQYPTQAFHDAAIYLMGYMINNASAGITYGGALRVPMGLNEQPLYFTESRGLYGSADSSWGTKPKPHGGHIVMRLNGAIMWKASALKVVADSTCEAETAEASRLTKDLIYARAVVSSCKRPVIGPSLILGDNSPMMDLVTKEGTSQRTRYFDRATLLVKYAVMQLIVAVKLVSTKMMIADILTKATDQETFERMRANIRNTKADTVSAKAQRLLAALTRVLV